MTEKGHSNLGFELDAGSHTSSPPRPITPRPKLPNKDERREKLHILKNILAISFAFFLLFSSFTSMANLQSSINPQVGTDALSVLYGALVLSCAFLPSLLIAALSVKWTMVLCVLGYSTYIAAQFAPSSYTLIPTAIVLGFGAAPMWSAKCTYLTQVGTRYAELVGEKSEVIITRFFGIFFLFFQSNQVAGNLIASTVLSRAAPPPRTEDQLEFCGANFCPSHKSDNSTIIDPPDMREIYIMSSIFLTLSLLSSVVIAVCVDPLSRFVSGPTSSGEKGCSLLVATFGHMRHPYQLLLIPLTMWSGLEQGFIGADFTAAYVSCGLGVHMVGYVMICFGVCDAACSLAFTPMVKVVGRVPVFVLAALVNAACIVVMMTWAPRPDSLFVFFLVAALWGVSDAVWQTQINALYGVVFPGKSEAAFANYRLWESIGYIINYATHNHLCTTTKVGLLVVFLAVGMLGYAVVELCERCRWLPRDDQGRVKRVLA